MEDLLILGLCGYAGSGKDTIAEVLCDHGFHRVAYADKLKELAWVSNPVVDLDSDNLPIKLQDFVSEYGTEDMDVIEKVDIAKRWSAFGREYLQHLGDGMRQVFGDSFWRDQLDAEIERLYEEGHDKIVITDIRYPNELAPVHKLFSIVRPGVGAVNDHKTEQSFAALHNLADVAIFNDRTPEAAALEILDTLN